MTHLSVNIKFIVNLSTYHYTSLVLPPPHFRSFGRAAVSPMTVPDPNCHQSPPLSHGLCQCHFVVLETYIYIQKVGAGVGHSAFQVLQCDHG